MLAPKHQKKHEIIGWKIATRDFGRSMGYLADGVYQKDTEFFKVVHLKKYH